MRKDNIELVACGPVNAGGEQLGAECIAPFTLLDYGIDLKIPFIMKVSNKGVCISLIDTTTTFHYKYSNVDPMPGMISFKSNRSFEPFVDLILKYIEDMGIKHYGGDIRPLTTAKKNYD